LTTSWSGWAWTASRNCRRWHRTCPRSPTWRPSSPTLPDRRWSPTDRPRAPRRPSPPQPRTTRGHHVPRTSRPRTRIGAAGNGTRRNRVMAEAEGVRLQKVLAAAGVGSRRACEQLIDELRVEVNGRLVETQGMRVDPERDVIRVDG